MNARPGNRLLALLPAIYRSDDAGDDLLPLLRVFEEFLFDGHVDAQIRTDGIERRLKAVPTLFAPHGLDGDNAGAQESEEGRTPERFLPWLASWLAFTPRDLFEPERLRHVVAGIVPLYGRRGTRVYLEALLTLCFEEIAAVQIDEREQVGLRVGLSRLGVDSLLARERPFWFGVDIELRRDAMAAVRPTAAMRFEQQVRAVIDFAKPAHTAYELRMHRAHSGASASG
jgi:phage tail-like protein